MQFRFISFKQLTILLPSQVVNHMRIDDLIHQFHLYFQRTWLTPEKIPRRNHFENDGPRTNNAVEGWHSSLKNKFSQTHLHLAKFLCELQGMCHDVGIRLVELMKGEPPKVRVATYVQNDARIQQAKHHFANFLNIYNVVPIPVGFQNADAWLDSEIW